MGKNAYDKIPVITLRGLVVYPGNNMNFDISRKQSILALRKAMETDKKICFIAQKDFSIEDPTANDLYDIGVMATVVQVIRNENNSIKILVETIEKANIVDLYNNEGFFEANVEVILPVKYELDVYCKGLMKTAKNLFNEYCNLIKRMPDEIWLADITSQDPVFVAEYIAGHTIINVESKQKVLSADNPVEKLEILIESLSNELDLMIIEEDILEKLHNKIEKHQREYYLREQLKVISEELGEESSLDEKIDYETKIKKLKLIDKTIESKLLDETNKLSKMSYTSPEASVIRSYLDICLSLPWNKSTKDKINIKKSKQILDKEHYGLDNIKERIIELLSVIKLNSSKAKIQGQVLCFCGPPGVGKTSIAKSIAKTMGRKYIKISLGGVKDASDIRGHRRTYIGSMPGRIINAIKMAGTNNPLILLDEIDKMSNDFGSDPAAAMLEVLDIDQNSAFVDSYLELPFDLSKVLFIATANDKYSIPTPLLDRMEIIDITSYTTNEKICIAKKHLITKQLKLNGLTSKDIKIGDSAILEIIEYYTSESGVRSLERNISKICRKIVQRKILSIENDQPLDKIVISCKNLADYLGPRKFKPNVVLSKDEIGIATGLAWTSVGGEIMHIEVSALEGSGKIELTGNLGEVMRESAKAAISYVRSRSKALGIDENFYKNKDIHIHVPEGAVPKDGPSAGVTICTALVSELTQNPVKRNMAMTGEITLRGRLLNIGGLKEKTMAAYKTGIKIVLLPKDNEPDLYEIDPVVKESVEFIPVDKIESVLDKVLVYPVKNLDDSCAVKIN